MTKQKGIVRFEDGIEEDIQAFQEQGYPHREASSILPFWRWQFIESAARLQTEPRVWGYRRLAQLVAHQGALVVEVKLGSMLRKTGWFVETMALESVRGLPIGPMLIQSALEDLPFNLSLGQTEYMRELQYSLGWREVASLNHYVFAPTYQQDLSGSLPRGLAHLGSIGIGFLHKWKLRNHRYAAQDHRLRRITEFSEESHGPLWDQMSGNAENCVVRDPSYMNWKYIDQPQAPYCCWELWRGTDICGLVVTRTTPPDSVYKHTRGHIVDFVFDTRDNVLFQALLATSIEKLVAQGAANINLYLTDQTLERAVRSFGFVSRGARHHLLVASSDNDSERNQVFDESKWFLTMGDSDVDRFL